jgi:hypothetical protein
VIASPRLARTHPELERGKAADSDTESRRRALTILTAIIAVTGLVDAAAQVTLALTRSTSQFGVYAHVASYVIIGSGLAVGALYVRHVRARLRNRPGPDS